MLVGTVRDVTQEGACAVETEQGVVLTYGALPGEAVRVRIRERRQGVLRGELERVVTPSPDRREPACTLAARCGGCPLMSLRSQAARALKLEHVARAVQGVCLPDVLPQFEAPGQELGYRRRVRLSFRKTGAGTLLGYHAAGSRLLIDAPTCLVLETALQNALSALRSALFPTLEGAGEIELAQVEPDGVVVHIACDAPALPALYRAAEGLVGNAGIRGVELRVQKGAPATFGDTRQASIAGDGLPLRAPVSSFAQANSDVNARLCALVTELAEARGARLLELYAGHGNLTVALARQAAELDAFELDAAAAEACRLNLRERGLDAARVHASDASDLANTERAVRSADTIVLDPPRGGAPGLSALVARCRPARVVYVSCHMTTLGRDLRALAALGYRADRVHALDMFPQTAHIEAVVRLQRGVDPQ